MSKAGAVVTRQVRELAERAETVARIGLARTAVAEYQEREAERIERAKSRLSALVANAYGIANIRPYVEKRFAQLYADHQRVCVEIDGLIINYLRHTRDGQTREYLQLVLGECERCSYPVNMQADTLDDLGRSLSAAELRGAVLCGTCSRKERE